MLIIDTNVISEMMKSSPSPQVVSWFSSQKTEDLFITTITIAEISYGIQSLPNGHKRDVLHETFKNVIEETFKYRILSFDTVAAHAYRKIAANRKKIGKPLSVLDGQIAAIARAFKASIVSRNVRDFVECGLTLINPFI
jgi:predicted nucleic acid-binding protein